MTTIIRKIILIVFVLTTLISTQAHADKRKFQIDILVFSQDTATTEMIDAPGTPLSWPKRLIQLGQKSTEELSTSSSALLEAASKLGRKPQYSILKHISWTQTIASERAGRPVRIQGNGVNGFVQLKRGHNLHLTIGMEYPNQITGNTLTLSEQRRVLFNQKHYFDHPRFGVIAHVSPL